MRVFAKRKTCRFGRGRARRERDFVLLSMADTSPTSNTPSTARTARMTVMRHAAASQQSLAALRERPQSSAASGAEEACPPWLSPALTPEAVADPIEWRAALDGIILFLIGDEGYEGLFHKQLNHGVSRR